MRMDAYLASIISNDRIKRGDTRIFGIMSYLYRWTGIGWKAITVQCNLSTKTVESGFDISRNGALHIKCGII